MYLLKPSYCKVIEGCEIRVSSYAMLRKMTAIQHGHQRPAISFSIFDRNGMKYKIVKNLAPL
jgi:hypothetical protein